GQTPREGGPGVATPIQHRHAGTDGALSVVILHAGSLVQWTITWPDVFFQPVDGYPCSCLRSRVRHNLDVLFSPADTDVCSSGAGRADGRRLVHLHQPPQTVRAAAALVARSQIASGCRLLLFI